MTRLADYFAVVGYDHNRGRNGARGGKILQRFPERDWPGTPFIDGLELFCQPQGWSLSCERQEPQFFVCVLTDFNASRHYCAVLSFNEAHAITPTHAHADEEEDGLLELSSSSSALSLVAGAGAGGGTASNGCNSGNGGGSAGNSNGNSAVVLAGGHHSIMYAVKCLVLVSTLDCFSTFRNCLGLVYTVHSEGLNVSLETLVGNMVGYVQVPPPGGPQVRFSIGAGDRQALQPPASPSLPVTHTTVLSLFTQLGIRNVMVLFCAAVTENKLLFHSLSYTRLTDACHALKALIYPFHYTHVYIPILPSPLVEVLSTPTPFIMGVHSSLRHDVSQLMDVIVVDLDGGSIRVPDSLALSLLNEPYWSEVQSALSKVLHPDLFIADNAFSSSSLPHATPHVLKDMQLRAVFMRLFARLLQGYRSCLTLIRIHSSPVLTFHKAAFLGQRCFQDLEFISKLLDCMFFTEFVSFRGLPWRVCDLWDELYSQTPEQQRLELQDPRLILTHIKELGHQLYNNENPNPQFEAKIPKPTEGSFTRIHQPVFPRLDATKIQAIIDEGTSKEVKIPKSKDQPKIVPIGAHISTLQTMGLGGSSAQRLKVLRDCVSCIFESKISDARKTFPAVLRALKTKAARLALCSELALHVQRNKAVLEHEQFDLVVRLMNCALQDTSQMDEHGVAAALLPLSTAFCRKLCTGVMQFAYTCIQEHPVWANHQFWEAAFYEDVQKDIRTLYLDQVKEHNNHFGPLFPSSRPGDVSGLDLVNFKERRTSYFPPSSQQLSALDIAAERLRIWPSLPPAKQQELNEQEESTLYSQAIHFAYRMVYLRIPLDINTSFHHRRPLPDNTSASFTNSVAESDSMDAESGFEEQEQSDRETSVIRFVSRFVDKVCTEGKVTDEHIKSLHQMIPGVVAMHIETLDMVYKESKRLPPTQKHKIVQPSLIPGEKLEMEGLRVHLLPDGREDGVGIKGGPVLLPAEGALFLTNYRLIFKGLPTDPYACEQVIVRALPLCSITREKRVSGGQHHGLMDQWTTDGLQIRSATFQLLRVAFDEEVSPEAIEALRKLLNRLRHPTSVLQVFAFTGHCQVVCAPSRREKDKQGYGTLRGFAKKTLLKTAKAAGLKSGKGRKQDKYVFGAGPGARRGLMARGGTTMLPPGAGGPGSNLSAGGGGGGLGGGGGAGGMGGGGGGGLSRVSLFPSSSSLLHHHHHSASRVTMTLPQTRPIDISAEDLHSAEDAQGDQDDSSGGNGGGGGNGVGGGNNLHHLHHQRGGGAGSAEVDNKTLEKLTERSYYRDYHRLGLGGLLPLSPVGSGGGCGGGSGGGAQSPPLPQPGQSGGKKTDFRISPVNSSYQVCRSYPALVSVPSVLSDECVSRVGRLYRNGRFPVATWRHPNTRALLLRGAGVHSRTALTKLNRGAGAAAAAAAHQQQGVGSMSVGNVGGTVGVGGMAPIPSTSTPGGGGGMSSSSDGSSHSVEHEKFLSAIVAATPLAALRHGSAWRLADSSLSLNSLAHTASTHLQHHHHLQHAAGASVAAGGSGGGGGTLVNGSSLGGGDHTSTSNNTTRSAAQHYITGGGGGAGGDGGGTSGGGSVMLHSPPHGSGSSSSSSSRNTAGFISPTASSTAAGADTSFNTTLSHHQHSTTYGGGGGGGGGGSSSLNTTYNSSFPGSPYGSSYLQTSAGGGGATRGGGDDYPTLTPEVARRTNPLTKAINTLRSPGGGGGGSGSGSPFSRLGGSMRRPSAPIILGGGGGGGGAGGAGARDSFLGWWDSMSSGAAGFGSNTLRAFHSQHHKQHQPAAAPPLSPLLLVGSPSTSLAVPPLPHSREHHSSSSVGGGSAASAAAAGGGAGSRLSTVMVDAGTGSAAAADASTEVVRAFNTAALYIFGEKTHLKGLKTDVVHKTEFIIVDYPEVWQVKSAFKKLMRACIPSTSPADQDQSFYRLVEGSEWLVQLSSLLQRSGAVVDLTDLLGASVMLLLEDGWDFTAQVSSLAQVCLDPYYRTLEGFRVLVEKEWLAYGHRFLHRGNVLHSSQSAGFAPIFLQFLDAVHQIQRQFPLSFEFNEYYLRFLAYHSVSGRFRTFLSDCELDRVELGIMSEEDKRGSLSRHHKGLEAAHEDDIYPTGGGRLGSPTSSGGSSLGQSVFDYIDKLAARSPVFFNFLYAPDRAADSQVLRPVTVVSGLCVWEFLVGEELRHGPPYEPEVRQHDNMREEEEAAADGTAGRSSCRRVVSRGYDCLMACQPDVFTAQLEELRQLEQELGHLPHKWSMHWDKLEPPPQDMLQRQVSVTTQLVREHGRTVHKRSTLELLVRAKTLTALSAPTPPSAATPATHHHHHHHQDVAHSAGFTHPHRFEKYNYATPAYCDHCSSVLWGPIKTGLRCMDCGYNCHEKCVEGVANTCTRYKAGRDPSTAHHPPPPPQLDTASIASGVASQKPSQQTYDDYSSNVPENRTHEGYLWKRGSLLKNWKQRWFVLDSMKHQLRYYDTNDDPHAKGVIDMSEVVAVCSAVATQGAPKKIDEKAFFDLQTKKRVYNFCAFDAAAAQEWIEKIQACLQ